MKAHTLLLSVLAGGLASASAQEAAEAEFYKITTFPTPPDAARFSIYRNENKGRINKRLSARLDVTLLES